jgi:hypothetical protein
MPRSSKLPFLVSCPLTWLVLATALAVRKKERIIVWWADLLWGFWNGLTAWVVLIVHVFGGWEQFPFYNEARSGNWYDFGFLLGAGSPLLGALRGRGRGS